MTNCGMRFEVGGGDASLACAWFVSVFNVENRTRQYFCMYYTGGGGDASLVWAWFDFQQSSITARLLPFYSDHI